MRTPTHLDRYPAKMVSRLADRLVERYASNASRLLDPFCGSGAVLVAANRRGIPVTGVDLNPIAALFSTIKLNGFSANKASDLAHELIRTALGTKRILPIHWSAKHYWFTPLTVEKFERLRAASKHLNLQASGEGMAVLLSLSLSVRLCSRADQRSPKPFISKQAKEVRKRRHFDPYRTFLGVLQELSGLYGRPSLSANCQFILTDVTSDYSIQDQIGKHSHVITSPPYINAQDYFRNFKLELYLLERLLPYKIADLQHRFVGTERGNLLAQISKDTLQTNYQLLPRLKSLNRRAPRLADVVHRYLYDMGKAFDIIKDCLAPNAVFVLVCGDNLIGGIRIRTWQVLRQMIEHRGFKLFDLFADRIQNRMLAPKRCGHKGLIKEEVVCAYRME
jgi:hypothetical protein